MREPKQGDSPSGYDRDVYPLRSPERRLSRDLDDYLFRVKARALALVANNPALEGEDPRVLFARMITPETSPDYDSALRRAAFGLLLARAIDRAEGASPFTGGEAA